MLAYETILNTIRRNQGSATTFALSAYASRVGSASAIIVRREQIRKGIHGNNHRENATCRTNSHYLLLFLYWSLSRTPYPPGRDESVGFQTSAAGGRSSSSKNARFRLANALRSCAGIDEADVLRNRFPNMRTS